MSGYIVIVNPKGTGRARRLYPVRPVFGTFGGFRCAGYTLTGADVYGFMCGACDFVRADDAEAFAGYVKSLMQSSSSTFASETVRVERRG